MKNLLKIKIREELLNTYNNKDDSILKFTKKHLIKKDLIFHLNLILEKFPNFYKKVFNLISHKNLPDGLGKGEILLYFLYDDIDVSGIKLQTDIIKNGIPCFEVKSVRNSKNILYNFRLGVNSKELSREFIENLKSLCKFYEQILQNSPDIINWEEIPKRVLDYIESFGDVNDLQKIHGSFKILFQLDEKCNIIDSEHNNLGHILNDDSLHKLMTKWRIKKDNFHKIKIKLSSVEKIKQNFIFKLVKSEDNKIPILFFDSKSGKPLAFSKLNSKNISILRVTQGHVRIGFNIESKNNEI